MLATHNSMTYLPAVNPFFNLFSFLWRCQNRTEFGQTLLGADYLDFRVAFRKGRLTFAHGIVDLRTPPGGVIFAIKDMDAFVKGFRVVLERGSEEDAAKLRTLLAQAKLRHLTHIIIKKDWRVIFRRKRPGVPYSIIDHSFVPFTSDKPWYKQLGLHIINYPKRYARRHNGCVIRARADKDHLHFYDFINISRSR